MVSVLPTIVAADRASQNVLTGGTDVEALLTQRMADAKFDARVVIQDLEARVNAAVASGEMSTATGREVMALVSRVVEMTAIEHAINEHLKDTDRVIDAIRRGCLLTEPSAHQKALLRAVGLEWAGPPRVVHLLGEIGGFYGQAA